MSKRIYIVGLREGSLARAEEVSGHVTSAIEHANLPVRLIKTTRAGCLVVEADEDFERFVKLNHPELFIEEERRYYPVEEK